MVRVMTAAGREVSVSGFKMPKQRKPQSISQKLAKLEKQVKLNADEWKYFDLASSGTAIVTATLALLNGLVPGDGATNRDGRQVNVQSIQAKFRAENDVTSAGVDTRNTVRFIIFVDKQSNAAAPAAADILDLTSASAIDTMRNLNNRKRFKILMDRRYAISSAGPANIVDEFYIKRTNLVDTIFNAGTAGTIADITSGSIYLLYCSDTNTTPPSVVVTTRIRFTE